MSSVFKRYSVAKRIAITIYDGLSALAAAWLLSFAFVVPAFGYIDPSVMTYTIQAVAGVAVALSAVAGVAFRRGRKHLLRILDIDKNAHRVIESDVHRLDAEGRPIYEAIADVGLSDIVEPLNEEAQAFLQQDQESLQEEQVCSQKEWEPLQQEIPSINQPNVVLRPALYHEQLIAQREAASGEAASGDALKQETSFKSAKHARSATTTRFKSPFGKAYKPTWKERLVFGLIVAFFFAFTIYFVAPLEVVAGSSASLTYSMGDVWWVLVPPLFGMVALIALVLTLLRGRAYNIVLLLVAAVGLCAYVQALALNVGLPAADGATIQWSDYMGMQIVSSIVWVTIIVAAIVFALVHAKRAQGVAAIVAVFLVIVQGVGLASLALEPVISVSEVDSASSKGKVVMTEDQLYTVNPNHNVIVFVLDTYDTAYLSRVLDMNPNLLDGLTGFTEYENATSAMIPTRFAIPEMMTGQMPSFDEDFSTYKAQRYARSDFLDKIYDANYSLGLYTDSLTISRLSAEEQYGITSKTVNMHDLPDSTMDVPGTLYSLYQIGQYRDVLWPFKWAFWYYTDQINQSMVLYSDDASPEQTIYVMDDIRYYNRLCDFGLTLEEGNYDGAFRFIHLLGSHYPFSYDEDVNDLGEDNSDVFKQSQGAIKIVTTYIDELKRLGVYENTTMIITADHGYWTITLDPIEETSTPIMFVKSEQSKEADARPLVIDEKPVSHLDLQATVLDAMGLDYSEYSNRDEWAGYSMLRDINPNRKRYYLTTDSEPDLTEVQFREYLIDGNALDWDNWSETGRTIDAQK